MGTKMTLTFV